MFWFQLFIFGLIGWVLLFSHYLVQFKWDTNVICLTYIVFIYNCHFGSGRGCMWKKLYRLHYIITNINNILCIPLWYSWSQHINRLVQMTDEVWLNHISFSIYLTKWLELCHSLCQNSLLHVWHWFVRLTSRSLQQRNQTSCNGHISSITWVIFSCLSAVTELTKPLMDCISGKFRIPINIPQIKFGVSLDLRKEREIHVVTMVLNWLSVMLCVSV